MHAPVTVAANQLSTWDTHRFCTDASTIGLAPGVVARTLVAPGVGNGQPFDLYLEDVCHGEVAGWFYRQRAGIVDILVIND